jgi:hypothetical protein
MCSIPMLSDIALQVALLRSAPVSGGRAQFDKKE